MNETVLPSLKHIFGAEKAERKILEKRAPQIHETPTSLFRFDAVISGQKNSSLYIDPWWDHIHVCLPEWILMCSSFSSDDGFCSC